MAQFLDHMLRRASYALACPPPAFSFHPIVVALAPFSPLMEPVSVGIPQARMVAARDFHLGPSGSVLLRIQYLLLAVEEDQANAPFALFPHSV